MVTTATVSLSFFISNLLLVATSLYEMPFRDQFVVEFGNFVTDLRQSRVRDERGRNFEFAF